MPSTGVDELVKQKLHARRKREQARGTAKKPVKKAPRPAPKKAATKKRRDEEAREEEARPEEGRDEEAREEEAGPPPLSPFLRRVGWFLGTSLRNVRQEEP